MVLADEASPDCAGFGTLNRMNRSIGSIDLDLGRNQRPIKKSLVVSAFCRKAALSIPKDRNSAVMKVKARYPENGVLDRKQSRWPCVEGLGFSGVDGVRIGRYIEFDLEETDPDKAKAQSDEMCRKRWPTQ